MFDTSISEATMRPNPRQAPADPEATAGLKAVHLRLQLREELPLAPLPGLEGAIAEGLARLGGDGWAVQPPPARSKPPPLGRQIGPSCGLVVLRMAAARLLPGATRDNYGTTSRG
jgi:hypothetical protein